MKRFSRFRQSVQKDAHKFAPAIPKGQRNSGRNMRWLGSFFISLILLLFAATSIAAAHPITHPVKTFPPVIQLPDGFNPEGITSGRGTNFYVGSLANGAIFHGDYRTGKGEILVPGQEGLVSVGLWVDKRTNYLYVAGGPTGLARVYNAQTGKEIAVFALTSPGSFVNDVVVTRKAAYFTDSYRPYMYRVPLNRNGTLPATPMVQEIQLKGDFVEVPGEGVFNANGIDATPNGRWLIIVNSAAGALYRVSPKTGIAQEIDLQGGSVPNGDGILLDGRTLYVVQNANNQAAKLKLSPRLTSGKIIRVVTDRVVPFDFPTTIAGFGHWLYVVNARLELTPTPDTEYYIVRIHK